MSRAAVVFSLLIALAPLARAQEKNWKWDPLKQPKAKAEVGDRYFSEADDQQKQNVLVTLDGKEANKKDQDVKVTHRYTGETLKVEKDKPSEAHFKIEKWSRVEAEGEPDKSLEGKTIVVTGTGATKKWECTDKDAKLSKFAKAWIDKELAKKPKPGEKEDDEDDKNKLLFPEKAIGDGEEWTRDAEVIVKELFGGAFEADPEASTFKGKLTNVHVEDGVHYGHIEFKLSVKVKPSEQFSEGGTIEITFATDGSLEENKRQSAEEKMTLKVALDGGQDSEQGKVHVKLRIDNNGSKKHGPLKGEEKKK